MAEALVPIEMRRPRRAGSHEKDPTTEQGREEQPPQSIGCLHDIRLSVVPRAALHSAPPPFCNRADGACRSR